MIYRTNVKLNLGLSVLRRRDDGFHEIETVFIPFSGFGDTLLIEEAGTTTIEIDGPCYDGWDKSRDLTIQAYRLLSSDFDLPPVRIRLTKTAPVGAGLGGGSADAVAALKLLNSIFGLGLDASALENYAVRLGSDCAFFVGNRPCFARGRGEILSPCNLDLSQYEIIVEIPLGESVSTREAYSGIVPRDRRPERLPSLAQALEKPVSEWKNVLRNDFEDSVFPLHPRIAALKERFYSQGAVYAAMSGSGASVFALFEK